MRLTCPSCGVHGSIEAFTVDADARRYEDLLTEMPDRLPRLAKRYVALFRPQKRGLAWDRAYELLTELAVMVRAGHVENYGRQFPASPEVFANAIHQMLEGRDRLKLPLKGHGYLIAIIVGESPKAAAASEEQTEQQKRNDSQARHRAAESSEERMQRMREEQQKAEANRLLQGAVRRT